MIIEQYFIDDKWRKETDENEDGTEYYYYALDLADGFSFISGSNDEADDGEWTVGFFDCFPSMQFDDEYKLDSMIKIATEAMELGKLNKVDEIDNPVEFSLDDIDAMMKGFMNPQEPNEKLKTAAIDYTQASHDAACCDDDNPCECGMRGKSMFSKITKK